MQKGYHLVKLCNCSEEALLVTKRIRQDSGNKRNVFQQRKRERKNSEGRISGRRRKIVGRTRVPRDMLIASVSTRGGEFQASNLLDLSQIF